MIRSTEEKTMTAIIRETPIHEANESKVKSTGVAPLAPDKSVMDSSKRKRMSGIIVEEAKQPPVEEQRMEFVDLKGIGCPELDLRRDHGKRLNCSVQ